MNAKRTCPICSNTTVDHLHTQTFELPKDHPLSAGYSVVTCHRCGFVYADTTTTQTEYDRFYKDHSKYEDAKTGTGGVENPFDWKRQQETALQISNEIKDKNARIIDMGCANGGILKALKELGYANLCGIDPSPICVENTAKLGVEARQGSLFLPFEGDVCDCLILSHTLEHVQDLQGALHWINSCLKDNGVVYVETPDASRYKEYMYAPLQDFNTEHINHFSLTSLQNLMSSQKFTLLKSGTKDLTISPGLYYPALFGFWKKAEMPDQIQIINDPMLSQNIKEYISVSRKLMKGIENRIIALLSRSPEIIVWGTGQLTMKLLAETALARANILAFIDNNPVHYGQVLYGKPILSPMELAKWNAPILIATLLHHEAIVDQIQAMGLKNEIVLLKGESE